MMQRIRPAGECEAHRQSAAIAVVDRRNDDQEFIEAVSGSGMTNESWRRISATRLVDIERTMLAFLGLAN